MISNITSGSSFYQVALYNQKKVDKGEASILYSQKLRSTIPASLQRSFENYNLSISQRPVIHVSLSFAREDEAALNDEKILDLSKEYLAKMGYSHQPYIIYRHFDTPHPHVHILSTRVDITTQKRIDDSFEYIRSKQITNQIERAHGLTIADKQPAIKSSLVAHINAALQEAKPENINHLNEALHKNGAPVRAKETSKGLIYHGVGEDGRRHSKYYLSSSYKEVGLDAAGLTIQFQKNIQNRAYVTNNIQAALPKVGKTTIGLFTKDLQSKGINTEFKVNSDNSIDIRYHYKNRVFQDSSLRTTAQQQLIFPEPQDIRLRDQLTKSIAANEPLALDYQNSQLQIKTPNPELAQELNKRTDREKLAISDSYHQYQNQYQKTANPDIRKAILALAATDIDDTLQDKINAERLDQRKIRR